MTMIERVARALMEADGKKPAVCAGVCTYSRDWREYADDARTAIAAMREPTEGMVMAAEPTMQDFGWACREQVGPFPTQADIFTRMIDAALEER